MSLFPRWRELRQKLYSTTSWLESITNFVRWPPTPNSAIIAPMFLPLYRVNSQPRGSHSS
ncbi:MAG TPA: hypothetical protein VJL59_03940 [Anaerolineales bacterium]|nr:hypothetical protein [Anaerolineales bacterium]